MYHWLRESGTSAKNEQHSLKERSTHRHFVRAADFIEKDWKIPGRDINLQKGNSRC